ncbi:SixA phosphatase family protein [Pseudomonas matsuisoli]|uniref:Phosphohistidine phosphatase SixA n=1 Tax=Pseudomonas matsuisoli TaxID=1515666 RepID=A0A917V0R6_9PSED|nr:histidine phosphatase family protein [Pseudomonas matsuisoli]GGK05768.1 phosphohistidine phosphatase SixA [Pseudomonas matsuisoli]
MRVWLLRHGEAEPQASRDADRRLTPSGQAEVHAAARQLLGRPLRAIYVSPYARAQESADIVKHVTGFDAELITVAWLTPDTSPTSTFSQMQPADDGDVLYVAHQPLLGALSALLVHGESSRPFALSTAALVELEGDAILAGGMRLNGIH